jgi:hypothetical protein
LQALVAKLPMARFSLLLVHFSTNSIDLVSIFDSYAISAKQAENSFTINSNKYLYCTQKTSLFVSIVALSTHTTHLAKPHSRCDIGPSRAGLYVARFIQGWLHAWAVQIKLVLY